MLIRAKVRADLTKCNVVNCDATATIKDNASKHMDSLDHVPCKSVEGETISMYPLDTSWPNSSKSYGGSRTDVMSHVARLPNLLCHLGLPPIRRGHFDLMPPNALDGWRIGPPTGGA